MKNNPAAHCRSGLLAFLLVLFLTTNAMGHNLWLNPETHYPETGTVIEIGIGWGHDFPENRTHQDVREDLVHWISAIDPDGQTIEPERLSPERYRLAIEKPGVYIVSAHTRPGAFTITPEGRKWGDKTEVERPVRCVAYRIVAQTVIVAGGDQNLTGTPPLPVSVKLLADPSALAAGDTLPVQVLFEGQPLPGANLTAKYAGYAHEDKDHGHGRGDYPVEVVTDGDGKAAIQLSKPGFWIALLSHRPPYPNTKVCDEYMFNLAFTFQVKE